MIHFNENEIVTEFEMAATIFFRGWESESLNTERQGLITYQAVEGCCSDIMVRKKYEADCIISCTSTLFYDIC
jgi:hypothetical protein